MRNINSLMVINVRVEIYSCYNIFVGTIDPRKYEHLTHE